MAKNKKVETATETDKPKNALFALRQPLPYQLRYIAFQDNITQTDIVNDALTEYVSKWEKKNGPIPKK